MKFKLFLLDLMDFLAFALDTIKEKIDSIANGKPGKDG